MECWTNSELSLFLWLILYQRILQVMYNSQRPLSISSFATHPLSEDPPGHVQQSAPSFYLLFCDSPFIRGSSRSCTTGRGLSNFCWMSSATVWEDSRPISPIFLRTLHSKYHKHANLNPQKKLQPAKMLTFPEYTKIITTQSCFMN